VTRTLGKLAAAEFERAIAPYLGAARDDIALGPRAGADCGIVRLGDGRVMALTTDPLSIVPALGIERSARLAAQLLASDLWTSGIPPAYASVCLNLPPELADADLERYAGALGEAWRDLGVAVVTGHTGRYDGCDYSIVGACTLVGIGDEGRWISPAMARPGDRVIVTKGCAIEATVLAAFVIPERLGERLAAGEVEALRARVADVSVVAECRALLELGVRERGVTALHDATEGGVLGGLVELARACGHDVIAERARIPLPREAAAACAAWGGIDPGWTLAEGALIACVRPERCAAALAALAAAKIPAAEVGEVVAGRGIVRLIEEDGGERAIAEPEPDPYWAAYARALAEGWK
jgi:hydrogenase expression/formation protein HypE